jgi:ABC-type bacteriocin/lantibiotic exporter with double-glycine peptidase domain
MDEATSCLDPLSEAHILRNVRNCLPSATLIVISHRLSTVAGLGRILVLSAGRIINDGSGEAFLAAHGLPSNAMSPPPPTH